MSMREVWMDDYDTAAQKADDEWPFGDAYLLGIIEAIVEKNALFPMSNAERVRRIRYLLDARHLARQASSSV